IDAPELKKLAGVRCSNLRDDCKCAIYETRPDTCRGFECGWRVMAALGDDWRPDRSGIVLISKLQNNPPGYRPNSGVQIVLLRRDAVHNRELPGAIASWVTARVPLFLTVAAPVGLVAESAFLNASAEGAVRRQDRNALLRILEDKVVSLERRKLRPASFASAAPSSASA
ncbi:MAG TPA: hypothetical protein VHZ29_06675, partial [Rhizomicrobium sp.]|nr:hypothetical protein [Rhizomicrobium sp.]